jgi:hypothetical protein
MRTLISASILFGSALLVGCGPTGGTLHATCAGAWSGSNVPASVCAVYCLSNTPSSDVAVQIVQTAEQSAAFIAHVKQTRPTATDMTFNSVSAIWSGHFFNFVDSSSQLPLQFHLLTRGAPPPDLDNVEVFTNGSNETGGPVNVNGLICNIQGNSTDMF